MAGAQGSTNKRQGAGKRRLVGLALLAGTLAAGGFLLLGERRVEEGSLNADLCPAEAGGIAGSATLLLDLRKPLHGAAPGAMLRQLSRDLGAGMELQVFTLTGDARAPRRFVERFCKPYDNADLTIQTAKDQRQAVRDCDDPPAQLPPQLRSAVSAFCARRNALASRIDRLAQEAPQSQPVVNAHLIEALEETKRAFADRPPPRRLYLFSDMLQHADWYSHLDLDWTQWRFTDFEPLRDARKPPLPRTALPANLHVKVFYLPRGGLTEPARQRRAHQGFWRTYFNGADMDFADAPPLPAYATLPLMPSPAAKVAARERELLEQREENDRLLADMAQEQAALEEQRAEEAASEQERLALEEELRRLQQAVATARRRQAELAADEAALAPPADAPPELAPSPAEALEEESAAAPAASADLALAADQPTQQSLAPSQPEAVALPPAGLDAPLAPPVDAPPPCAVGLKPEFLASLEVDGYPGDRRVNYGAGVIAVRYTLGDDGATLDAEVMLERDRSSAARPSYLEALAEDTLAVVKAWEFEFEHADASLCAKRQQQTATFTYRSKCVGTPAPSCRTVRSNVAVLSNP